jgi:hypothetical protein
MKKISKKVGNHPTIEEGTIFLDPNDHQLKIKLMGEVYTIEEHDPNECFNPMYQ